MQNWDAALEDLNKLKDVIDSSVSRDSLDSLRYFVFAVECIGHGALVCKLPTVLPLLFCVIPVSMSFSAGVGVRKVKAISNV